MGKKVDAVKAVKAPEPTTKVKPIGGDKNGGERTVPLVREPRFYPTEDVKKPLRHRKAPRPPKLKKSLTPGTVVILLAGQHKQKLMCQVALSISTLNCSREKRRPKQQVRCLKNQLKVTLQVRKGRLCRSKLTSQFLLKFLRSHNCADIWNNYSPFVKSSFHMKWCFET